MTLADSPTNSELQEWLRLCTPEEKAELDALLRDVSPWRGLGRTEQFRKPGQSAFILLGGRGSGKTRAAAEDCLEQIRRRGGPGFLVNVVAMTAKDIDLTIMNGDSGLLKCALPGEIVKYNQSTQQLTFANGSVVNSFSGETPDRLNGPQCHHLWIDEFGLASTDLIDMAMLGARLKDSKGRGRTVCGSSTPKPRKGTKHFLSMFPDAQVSRMKMKDNADNLDRQFIDDVERRYGGTRLGRAELDGELIEDNPGALWNSSHFTHDGFRLPPALVKRDRLLETQLPDGIIKIVVALDPSVTDPELKKNPHKEPDACGIVVAGTDGTNFYVLGDYTEVLKPSDWAAAAVKLFSAFGANKIIAEGNQGGELVREIIRNIANVPVEIVHASMGKRPRAEGLALLYDQQRAYHCGDLRLLEDEMTGWEANNPAAASPNRLDALVWAAHGLGLCMATGMKITNVMQNGQVSKKLTPDDIMAGRF